VRDVALRTPCFSNFISYMLVFSQLIIDKKSIFSEKARQRIEIQNP